MEFSEWSEDEMQLADWFDFPELWMSITFPEGDGWKTNFAYRSQIVTLHGYVESAKFGRPRNYVICCLSLSVDFLRTNSAVEEYQTFLIQFSLRKRPFTSLAQNPS